MHKIAAAKNDMCQAFLSLKHGTHACQHEGATRERVAEDDQGLVDRERQLRAEDAVVHEPEHGADDDRRCHQSAHNLPRDAAATAGATAGAL